MEKDRKARCARVRAHYERTTKSFGKRRELPFCHALGLIALGAAAFYGFLKGINYLNTLNTYVAFLVMASVILAAGYGSIVAKQKLIRAEYFQKYGVPPFESLDKWNEVEDRMETGKPFGVFLRGFSEELPSGIDYDPDTNMPNDVHVDSRYQEAIKEFLVSIGCWPVYCLLNPSDPIHKTPFITVLADPENWVGEVGRILSRANWIFLHYEFACKGLDTEIGMIAADPHLAAKAVVISSPWVKENDKRLRRLASICRWSLRLRLSENRTYRGDWPAFVLDPPPELVAWLTVPRSSS